MARKFKTPSYIRACDKCGTGKGYHSESVDYRLCDTCFRAKCDKQMEEALLKSAPTQELRDTAKSMLDSGKIQIIGVGF